MNPTAQVRNPQTTLHQLEETHRECQGVRGRTRAFVRQITAGHRVERGEILFRQVHIVSYSGLSSNKAWTKSRQSFIPSAVCTSRFVKLWAHFNKDVSKQTWSWEEQRKYGTLLRFLQREEEDIRAGICQVYETLQLFIHSLRHFVFCFL